MKVTETLCRKPTKTYLMSSKVRKATLIVCIIEHADGSKGAGIAAISESHALFAKATDVRPETLVLAAEIVHSNMYFITDEALRVALLIADANVQQDDPHLIEMARHYLCQGMTISKVRDVAKRTKSCMKTLEEIAESLHRNGITSRDTTEALAA